jgi:hypothetical protein
MAKRKISGIINATEHPMNLETPWNQKQPDGTYHAYDGDDVEAFLKKELSNRTPTEELVSGETKPPTSGTVFVCNGGYGDGRGCAGQRGRHSICDDREAEG